MLDILTTNFTCTAWRHGGSESRQSQQCRAKNHFWSTE